jgi:hypothetical protein
MLLRIFCRLILADNPLSPGQFLGEFILENSEEAKKCIAASNFLDGQQYHLLLYA